MYFNRRYAIKFSSDPSGSKINLLDPSNLERTSNIQRGKIKENKIKSEDYQQPFLLYFQAIF